MEDFQQVYDLYFKDVCKYALSSSRDPQTTEVEQKHLYQIVFR